MAIADVIRIACVGEAMIELCVIDGPGDSAKISFAGDVLNTAIYLKRSIGNHAMVSFVSALGTDVFSRQMLDMMLQEKLDIKHVVRNPDRMPGLYAIATDHGERSFSYWRDSSAARLLFQTSSDQYSFDALIESNVVYFSAITLAILPVEIRFALLNWLGEFRKTPGNTVVFDSNFRPQLWSNITDARAAVNAAWSVVDIGLPSLEDELALFGEATELDVLARLSAAGVKKGALKRGALGPIGLSGQDFKLNFPAATNVVDTTAAGDSFNGAYLAALLSGCSEPEAMLAGHRCASRVVSFPGAIIPKLGRHEL